MSRRADSTHSPACLGYLPGVEAVMGERHYALDAQYVSSMGKAGLTRRCHTGSYWSSQSLAMLSATVSRSRRASRMQISGSLSRSLRE